MFLRKLVLVFLLASLSTASAVSVEEEETTQPPAPVSESADIKEKILFLRAGPTFDSGVGQRLGFLAGGEVMFALQGPLWVGGAADVFSYGRIHGSTTDVQFSTIAIAELRSAGAMSFWVGLGAGSSTSLTVPFQIGFLLSPRVGADLKLFKNIHLGAQVSCWLKGGFDLQAGWASSSHSWTDITARVGYSF